MKKIFYLILFFFVLSGVISPIHAQTNGAQATFYISPSGSDVNPGTISQPFQTLTRARDAVRSVNKNMTGDIIVYLRGGYYQLSSPLTLDAGDSGTNGHLIIWQSYPGETALVSGGKTVTGWQQEGDKWKAFVGAGTDSRQLYVNGVRANRAAKDIEGKLGGGGILTKDQTLQTFQNQADMEVVDKLDGWQEFRCPVQSIAGSVIFVKEPCFTAATQATPGLHMNGVSSVENAYELLTKPGQWYLNKHTGWLYYMPKSGEDMTKAVVILPTLETLVAGNGTADTPIKNINLKSLVFSYATWLGPNTNDGFPHMQAEFIGGLTGYGMGKETPANITFSFGQNIGFEKNIFIHLGGVGLNFGTGTKNSAMIGNHFTDISAAAITLGDVTNPETTDSRLLTQSDTIDNNYIHDVGVEYHGSVGIWTGYTQGATITHNEVFNLPYSGISVGWGWASYPSTVAKNNTVSSNNIYNVMQEFGDGGGLYSLGPQPGNTYNQNYIHDYQALVIADYGAKPSGLDLDDGSRYITATLNYIHNVPVLHAIKGSDNTIVDVADWSQIQSVIAGAGLTSTYQAIKTLPTLPNPGAIPPPLSLPGDLNGDGKVDINDYNLMLSKFGDPYTIFDYNALVENFAK